MDSDAPRLAIISKFRNVARDLHHVRFGESLHSIFDRKCFSDLLPFTEYFLNKVYMELFCVFCATIALTKSEWHDPPHHKVSTYCY